MNMMDWILIIALAANLSVIEIWAYNKFIGLKR